MQLPYWSKFRLPGRDLPSNRNIKTGCSHFLISHSPDPRPQKVYPDCPLILRGKLALDLVNGRVEEKEGEKASLSRRMRWGVIVVSWFSVFMRNFKAIL